VSHKSDTKSSCLRSGVMSCGTYALVAGVLSNGCTQNPEGSIFNTMPDDVNCSWYQPYGSVAYLFAKHWTGRARWDYYGYHEDSNGSYQDLYAPRNFRANLVTLSVRYGF